MIQKVTVFDGRSLLTGHVVMCTAINSVLRCGANQFRYELLALYSSMS